MAVLKLKLVLGVTGIVALFVILSLVQEMNRRFQIQREVLELEQEAADMQRTITQLENLNQYFRTDDYQERLAREKLNYQAPGEKVVLIPDESRTAPTAAEKPAEPPRPIVEKWWRIFFVPEKE
jgi:cell division protein FtsB